MWQKCNTMTQASLNLHGYSPLHRQATAAHSKKRLVHSNEEIAISEVSAFHPHIKRHRQSQWA
jgi:hypothetical protein